MALVTSILTGGSNNHETTSQEVNAVATDFVNEGIVGDITNTNGVAPATGGFAVNAQGTPAMAVDVSAGAAYVEVIPTAQASQTLRVANSATEDVTISANSSGSTKYDWLYISLSATNAANPNTAADDVATLVTSRSSSASTDDGSPPTYGYPIAVITVANGASSITNANIRDIRNKVILDTGSAADSSGWAALGFTPNTVTYNGNRSYDLVFNSTDLTDTLSPGMRLKTTRTATAPTQCTDLEAGSSQYYSKSSPTGAIGTMTDDFTFMGWIKPESYGVMGIISKHNGSTGFIFYLTAEGQVRILGQGAGNHYYTSYQSVPLNKWTHVAASFDMSANSAAIYIDGVLVPSLEAGSGTSITQAGNLNLGAFNSANFFDGKLQQVAAFNAILSAATIRSYASQTLTGSETNCVGAWSFNNTINDLSANANNLTAQGSATATNADSPFALGADLVSGYTDGTTDFGIVMKTAFSTNTTLTVQVPEGCTIPTSGGVSAVAYSTQASPYGFPNEHGRWRVSYTLRAAMSQASNATFAALTGLNFIVPVGAWDVGWKGNIYNSTTTQCAWTLSNLNQTGLAITTSDTTLQTIIQSSAAAAYHTQQYLQAPYTLSTASTFTMYTVGSTTGVGIQGNASGSELFAECAYV